MKDKARTLCEIEDLSIDRSITELCGAVGSANHRSILNKSDRIEGGDS